MKNFKTILAGALVALLASSQFIAILLGGDALDYKNHVTVIILIIISTIYVRGIRLLSFMVPLIVMSFYIVLTLIVREIPDYTYAFMVFLWVFLCAVIFPFLVETETQWDIFLKSLAIVFIISICFTYFWSLTHNIQLDFGESTRYTIFGGKTRITRSTLGLGNPIYAGGVLFSGFWLSFALYTYNGKNFWRILSFLFFFALVSTDNRSKIYTTIIALGFYFSINRRGLLKKALSLNIILLALTFPFLFLIIGISSGEIDLTFNELSSGRIAFWTNVLKIHYQKDEIIRLLFGSGRGIMPSLNAMFIMSQKSAYHYDSTFLEFFLRYGVIGFSLFILAFFSHFKKSFAMANKYSSEQNNPLFRLMCCSATILFAIILVSVSDTTIPTLGNTIGVFLFPIAINLPNLKPGEKAPAEVKSRQKFGAPPVKYHRGMLSDS